MEYNFDNIREYLSKFNEFEDFFIEVSSLKSSIQYDCLNSLFQATISFITKFNPASITFLCQTIKDYEYATKKRGEVY